jgi:hypothetical protein
MTIKLTDARANVHLDLTMSTEADIEALIAAVRAETLREVATRMDEAAKRNLVDGYHETAEAFTMARDITLALEGR